MQIAPSNYYAAKTRPPSARSVADQQRLEVIRRGANPAPTGPRPTGSIERFHRTLVGGGALKKFYTSESARLAALPAWTQVNRWIEA